MDADERRLLIDEITEKVIACAFTVSNKLGAGFLEKIYENALAMELVKSGLSVIQQAPIKIYYDGTIIGEYLGDLVVEQLVLVELKTVRAFDDIHTAQCLNYLKATGLTVCLLMNFAKPRVEIKRIVNNF
jgi:GxxExxY protein